MKYLKTFKKINEDSDIDYNRENVNIIKNSVPIFRNVIQQIVDTTEFKDIKVQEDALIYTINDETGGLDMVISEYIEKEDEYFLEYDSVINGTYLNGVLTFIIEINNSIVTYSDQWGRPVDSEKQFNYGPFTQKTKDLIRKLENKGFVCEDQYPSSSSYNELLVGYKISDIMKMSSNAMKKINEETISEEDNREYFELFKNSIPLLRKTINKELDKQKFDDKKVDEFVNLHYIYTDPVNDRDYGKLGDSMTHDIVGQAKNMLGYINVINGKYLTGALVFDVRIDNDKIISQGEGSRIYGQHIDLKEFEKKVQSFMKDIKSKGFHYEVSSPYQSYKSDYHIKVYFKIDDLIKMTTNAVKKINESEVKLDSGSPIDSRTPSFDRLISMQQLDELDENIVYDFKKVFPFFDMNKLKEFEYADLSEIKPGDWVVATYFQGGFDTCLFKVEEFGATDVSPRYTDDGEYDYIGRGDPYGGFYGIGLAYHIVKYEIILGEFLGMMDIMKKINQ